MVGSFCGGVCSSNGIHLIYPETNIQNDEREIEESNGCLVIVAYETSYNLPPGSAQARDDS